MDMLGLKNDLHTTSGRIYGMYLYYDTGKNSTTKRILSRISEGLNGL